MYRYEQFYCFFLIIESHLFTSKRQFVVILISQKTILFNTKHRLLRKKQWYELRTGDILPGT